MKRLLAILALLSIPASCAGTFKKLGEGRYAYTGEIVHSDLTEFKRIVGANERVELVVDSPGGALYASIELGDYTRSVSNKVTLVVGECYSGAAIWALGATDWRYKDQSSFHAWHLPWFSGGSPGDSDWMYVGYSTGSYLDRMIGVESSKRLMLAMCDVRSRLGINGFVVWSKSVPERRGLWTSDGWKWDDGTSSARSRLIPIPTFIKP